LSTCISNLIFYVLLTVHLDILI